MLILNIYYENGKYYAETNDKEILESPRFENLHSLYFWLWNNEIHGKTEISNLF
jgi:hypothetical protein